LKKKNCCMKKRNHYHLCCRPRRLLWPMVPTADEAAAVSDLEI
jgi:hypothetical protein